MRIGLIDVELILFVIQYLTKNERPKDMTLKDVDKLPIQRTWVADEAAELAQFEVVDKADIDKAEIVDAEQVRCGYWDTPTVAVEPIIYACWKPNFKHHSVVRCSNCKYEPPELSTNYDLYVKPESPGVLTTAQG